MWAIFGAHHPSIMHPKVFQFEEGETLLIDKPYEWTSFDIVRKLRYLIKIKKIGHAGTLDPLATGLLIVCTGRMTKRIDEYQGMPKEYTGTFVLGKTTPSFDLETEVRQVSSIAHLTEADIRKATSQFLGEQQQIPPIFSAVMVNGKRAYEIARKGKEVALAPKPIRIEAFDITDIRGEEIDFRIQCSKGTYIRSIARDFGEQLGVGAYLSALRRTAIGDFRVENAYQVAAFEALIKTPPASPQTDIL
jgi:tRNA pseudouridine55 synthase